MESDQAPTGSSDAVAALRRARGHGPLKFGWPQVPEHSNGMEWMVCQAAPFYKLYGSPLLCVYSHHCSDVMFGVTIGKLGMDLRGRFGDPLVSLVMDDERPTNESRRS